MTALHFTTRAKLVAKQQVGLPLQLRDKEGRLAQTFSLKCIVLVMQDF